MICDVYGLTSLCLGLLSLPALLKGGDRTYLHHLHFGEHEIIASTLLTTSFIKYPLDYFSTSFKKRKETEVLYIIHKVNAIACNSKRFPKMGICVFLHAVVLLLCSVSMSVQLGCFVKTVVLYLFFLHI